MEGPRARRLSGARACGSVAPMDKILRFWRRPGRTRLRGLDEFRDPPFKGQVRFAEHRVTARGLVRDTLWWLRNFMIGAVAIGVLWPALDPALVEPPGFLATEPEPINRTFLRCDQPHGHACVTDGDTFRLGKRRIRIIGIDAPETHPPRCAKEAELGEAATVKLQELLNDGPFEMVGRLGGMKDRYGRELRALRRVTADGGYASLAEQMRSSGLARRYTGGFRSGWC